MPTLKFASMLVGRWPSGAPVMRTPAADNAALAGDVWANNHFIFDDTHPPVACYARSPATAATPSRRRPTDMLGSVCPHFAHIRKTNPRDSATDLGKPHDSCCA